MLPLLIILQKSTQGTVYDEQNTLKDSISDIYHPISPEAVAERLEQISQTGHRLMDTPQDRLVAAVSNSLYPADIASPAEYFYGAQFYWPLIVLAILFSKRRRDALICTWYVCVFCIFSLGPLYKTPEGSADGLLPYYFYHLLYDGVSGGSGEGLHREAAESFAY